MWYTYIVEYYSAIKENEILPFATKWIEGIMLSKISQTEKTNTVWCQLYVESKNKIKWKQNHRYKEQMSGFWEEGVGVK